MANTLESHIYAIVARASSEIAAALRANIAAEVNKVLAGAGAPVGRAAATKHKAGRTLKAARSARAAQKAPTKQRSTTHRRGKPDWRRSSGQVNADNGKLLAYIKANSGKRSEEIQRAVGMPKPNVAVGLRALRATDKIKMKGDKRGATYIAV